MRVCDIVYSLCSAGLSSGKMAEPQQHESMMACSDDGSADEACTSVAPEAQIWPKSGSKSKSDDPTNLPSQICCLLPPHPVSER